MHSAAERGGRGGLRLGRGGWAGRAANSRAKGRVRSFFVLVRPGDTLPKMSRARRPHVHAHTPRNQDKMAIFISFWTLLDKGDNPNAGRRIEKKGKKGKV